METQQLLKILHQLRDEGTRFRVRTAPKTWTEKRYFIDRVQSVTSGSIESIVLTFKEIDAKETMVLDLDRLTGLLFETVVSIDGIEATQILIDGTNFRLTTSEN